MDGNEYQVVFDTLETIEDLGFSVRNEELIIETLTIHDDSSAIASYDHIDAKMIVTSTVVNDSTVYDTTYPVAVTNVAGDITYDIGVDYTINPTVGIFFITTLLSVNIVAASIGSVAFLDPEILIVPDIF